MKQVGPLPKTLVLAHTLARRVNQLRELRNMTIRDLAKATKFSIKRIEELEGGLETWLSATDRQLLSKGLSVEPALIQEVEVRYNQENSSGYQFISDVIKEDLAQAVLVGALPLKCPMCGETLKCTIQHGLDIEGRAVKLARAHCLRCPFIL